MNSSRIALTAAVAAVGFWTLKSISIGLAGGLGRSPAEDIFFFAGLLPFAVAVVSLGVALTRGSRVWLRVLAGVGALAAGVASSFVLNQVIVSVRDPEESAHWAWGEVNLWIMGVVVLVLAVRVSRRQAPASAVRRPVTAAGR